MLRLLSVVIALIVIPSVFTREVAAENLLRNGSFEGALLYWHNVDEQKHSLAADAKVGEQALQLTDGYVMSAPFAAERGKAYTISLWIKGKKPGSIGVGMPPSAREEGTKSGRLWTKGASQQVEFGTEWQRVWVSFPADVPRSGFWPLPHYMVSIGSSKGNVVLVDGVTVTEGTTAEKDYLPRRAVEVVSYCENLPGYKSGSGNLFEKGATANIAGHFSNPGTAPQTITATWQLIDYEGVKPVGEPIQKTLTLKPGETISETVPMKLTAVGCVLARVSATNTKGIQIDKSDFPVTSLPYPKSATKPDWRERFGGSFAGGKGCIEKFQKIGFGWTRWRPHANGRDHLPEEPADKTDPSTWKWTWFDDILDEQEAHGVSSHIVLYPPPLWVMEKAHGGHPLPKDMRWPADDPRWNDLTIRTVWDHFVEQAVKHYRGRSVIFEIENEPELDRWNDKKEQYAQFTKRTARLIKQTDPKAVVMVDNVYGIPSGINSAFLKAGGGEFVDVISWHDYHSGWLADYDRIQQYKLNLKKHGAEHIEIWFNEGWAFTNTAVDEPIACTSLTSAESANAIFDSVSEMTLAGQEKTVLFHTAYETHGMSFWDYSGPGTMLWDWYDNPLPLVAAWNVLAHHIGVSDEVGFVRPPGANFCVFQDERNGKGVVIAYADRGSQQDVTVQLPKFGTPLIFEDAMGNRTRETSAADVSGSSSVLTLSKTGRPAIIYAADSSIDGKTFYSALEPLDRRYASFVSTGAAGESPVWNLPAAWKGAKIGSSDGSVVKANEQPVWKLEHVWPPDPTVEKNFVPMIWSGTEWKTKEGHFGGQPSAKIKDDTLILATRAPHGSPPKRRTCALTYVVPQDGTFTFMGTANPRVWDGNNKTRLQLYRRSQGKVMAEGSITIDDEGTALLTQLSVEAKKGDQLSFVPVVDGMFAGCNLTFKDFSVTLGQGASNSAPQYKLPDAWKGKTIGKTDGNPILNGDTPVWRIDQLHPAKPEIVTSYSTMPWAGTEWKPSKNTHGGQPAVKIENGNAKLGVAGPWQNYEFQKTAAVVFIAPESGKYRVTTTAHAKPWTGGAKSFPLSIRKKDTQRAPELKRFELPKDNSKVEIDLEVELNAGHELVILPLMPAWNNATNIWLDDLMVIQMD